LAFLILEWEYEEEKFSYLFFTPFIGSLKNLESFLVIPILLFPGIFLFAFLTFLFKKEFGFKNHLKQAILTGIFLVFYYLLITLELDTNTGSFFHPIWLPELELKVVYVRSLLGLLLGGVYAFGIWSILSPSPVIGVYGKCFWYFWLVPFLFRFSPTYHA